MRSDVDSRGWSLNTGQCGTREDVKTEQARAQAVRRRMGGLKTIDSETVFHICVDVFACEGRVKDKTTLYMCAGRVVLSVDVACTYL